MANVLAYPDLALEKLTGLDTNEDARDFVDIVEKKIEFSLGLDQQTQVAIRMHLRDKTPYLVQYEEFQPLNGIRDKQQIYLGTI